MDPNAAAGIARDSLALPACGPPILAMGAELKSGFCLARDGEAWLRVLGDELTDPVARELYLREINALSASLGITPQYAAHDLHPDYASTRHAIASGLRLVPVQHHHAHMAAVMAEHGVDGSAIGVVFDGMGWGDDGGLWGGEFLVGDCVSVRRAGRLAPVAQPGGDAAAREPWRMALSYLAHAFGEDWRSAGAGIIARQGRERAETVARAMALGINAPLTSSAGRLFEATSSILGICDVNAQPAQAAIALEQTAGEHGGEGFAFETSLIDGVWEADPSPGIRKMVESMSHGAEVGALAAGFHAGLARMVVEVCVKVSEPSATKRVTLSGGVFQNRLLASLCRERLTSAGFEVFCGERVPVHDGGLAYGQAAVATARLV